MRKKRLMMGRLISASGFCLPTGRLPMTRQNAFRDTLTLPLFDLQPLKLAKLIFERQKALSWIACKAMPLQPLMLLH